MSEFAHADVFASCVGFRTTGWKLGRLEQLQDSDGESPRCNLVALGLMIAVVELLSAGMSGCHLEEANFKQDACKLVLEILV